MRSIITTNGIHSNYKFLQFFRNNMLSTFWLFYLKIWQALFICHYLVQLFLLALKITGTKYWKRDYSNVETVCFLYIYFTHAPSVNVIVSFFVISLREMKSTSSIFINVITMANLLEPIRKFIEIYICDELHEYSILTPASVDPSLLRMDIKLE